MSIYTRRGDSGTTSLADGTRVSKSCERVEAYGGIDEANSLVGLARVDVTDELLDAVLRFAQQRLFNCSSSVATPDSGRTDRTPVVSEDDVRAMERAIDRFEERTPPLANFILPSGTGTAARLQVSRAATRRAERQLVSLAAHEPVDANVLAFVNRLSDLLFAASRYANALEGVGEDVWDPQAAPPPLG